ncbi:MAG: LytTR family DNA-binding domain-containing protein [Syntrophomonadaceae bacterium]|nr:LytTR family DNA-binding domain-containing protein [Syntrophomonadaceae bacterium]
MLNYVLMDDDIKHNLNMKKRLDFIFAKHGIEAATRLIATKPADVLQYSMENLNEDNVYFLDVDFGCDITGIELATKIRKYDARSYIVFVSAYPEFVMLSLKTKIFDFLIKPISIGILEKCILSLHKDFQSVRSDEKQTLVLKSGLKVYQLNMEDIIFLEKFGHLLVVHTLNGQISGTDSLENIKNKLDNNKFFRCHKSFIVNISHIQEIDFKNNLISFRNRESCSFSKRYKKELKIKCMAL